MPRMQMMIPPQQHRSALSRIPNPSCGANTSVNNDFQRMRNGSFLTFTKFSFSILHFITFIIIFSTNTLFIDSQELINSDETSESDGCDIPAFSPEETYSAHDKVSFKNVLYECKPPPNGGTWTWCSNVGYEPGVGLYWNGAWDDVGEVTGPCAEKEADDAEWVIEGDSESNHFFCGLDWGKVSNDCDAAQHCPSGTDDECELPGAVCFGGTTCDASKGHGKYFKYLGLAYEDTRNKLFCASSYADASLSCSIDQWCKDGICPSGMSCFGGLECNIQDLIRADMEEEKAAAKANGEADDDDDVDGADDADDGEQADNPDIEEDIESNHFFCGLNWNTISNDCDAAQHCPSGLDDECELFGAVCFGGSACDAGKGHGKLFKYLGLVYEDSRNRMFCASSWADAADSCSVENWCRDGMCPDGLSCFGVNHCNVQDFIRDELEKEKEANGESDEDEKTNKVILSIDDPKRTNFCGMTWGDASFQCSDWCPEGNECPEPQSCFADTNCYYDRDIVPSASPTTYPPTLSPTITYDRPDNFSFCGYGWADATQCTVERHCPNGDKDCTLPEICYNYLPDCNIVDLKKKQKPAPPPSTAPSRQPTDHPTAQAPVDTASSPSEWTVEWANVDEDEKQKPTSPPSMPPSMPPRPSNRPTTSRPTNSPVNWIVGWIDKEGWIDIEAKEEEEFQQVNPIGVEQNYCATTRSALDTSCVGAATCNAGDPPCPPGTYCWGNHLCEKSLADYATAEPTASPQARAKATNKPANPPTHPPKVNAATPVPTYMPTYSTYIPTKPPGDGGAPAPTLPNANDEASTNPDEICEPNAPCSEEGSRCTVGTETCCGETYDSLVCTCETNADGSLGYLCYHTDACMMPLCERPTYAPTSAGTDPPAEMKTTFEPTVAPEREATMKPTMKETVKPTTMIAYPTSSPESKVTVKPTSLPTKRATPMPTKMPTKSPISTPLDAKEEKGKAESGTPELYCASSMSELENSCESAQSCSHGPCPKGAFCFPFTCESRLKDDESISSKGETFYCAVSVSELDEKCGLATECTGNSKDCLLGYSCLRYDCNQSLDKCPLNFVGKHSSQDCQIYYECSNGVAGPEARCQSGWKFDKVRGLCVAEDLVDKYCYGPPITEIENEGQDAITTSPGLSPAERCPEGVVGWQSSVDCKEYHECRRNGSIGPTHVCGEGMKFDKVRGVCTEDLVNQYCYGPPITETENEDQEAITATPVAVPTERCPEGVVGWQSSVDCKEYHECRRDGSVGPTRVCGEGMKFDKVRGVCTEDLVNQYCYGPPITETNEKDQEAITATPVAVPTERCPEGFVGWQSGVDCNEYHECRRDGSVGPTRVCGEGMKFDKVRGVCTGDLVNQYCYGSALETVITSGATGNSAVVEDGVVSDGNAGTTYQTDTFDGQTDNVTGTSSVGNSGTKFSEENAGKSHQLGIHDGDSDSGSALQNDSPAAANTGNPYPTAADQPIPSLLVSASPSPPTVFGREPEVSSSGGRGDSRGETWTRTLPPTLKSTSGTSEIPPWYIHHTIVDPNEGERTTMQFMNTHTWLLLLALIQWMI